MSNTSSKTTELIAVSGGIGSGKSVVCAILRTLGHDVYDCDSEAKRLMDCDDGIKNDIACRISEDCIVGTEIDRRRLSEIVFADAEKLAILNSIVHDAVRTDILVWKESHRASQLFVETAILYQSGLDRMVDEVWEVSAPVDVRIRRVMQRNSLTADQVKARIEAQDSFKPEQMHPNIHTIVNDDATPLLPQIEKLLGI